jgi:beta-aspartyl-peptidase (threonine type)
MKGRVGKATMSRSSAGPAVAVHGGAGDPSEGDAPADRTGVRRAAEAAWAIVSRGGSALDAVEAAVRLLEDEPDVDRS